ncbi:hypothetical protein ACJBU6_03151 [Exserohilum turcicum]
MPSSSSTRSSSFGSSQRPSTPDSTRSAVSRSSSYAIAPRSEYLRNALQARRVQNGPPTSLPKLSLETPKASPDSFDKFALSEEQTTPVSPIRARRPSDAGPAPSKTNRELTKEIEKLKDALMTSNMRVELLKKDNRELQHSLTSAKEEIERLAPFEDESDELRTENDKLRLKIDNMDEEMAHLRETDQEQRKINEELTAIASESAAHFSAQESAIDEAAECIIKMEEEKAMLAKEIRELKARVVAIETSSTASTLVDGPIKCPSRVYSVDESRPSTSHFDSDYYSQPDSPKVKQSNESFTSFAPSERSKKFLDLTEQRKKSTRELVQRMSTVSLRALCDTSSPAPEVPPVPTKYQPQLTAPKEDDRSQTPRDWRGLQAAPPSLMQAPEARPARPHTVAPHAQAEPSPGGLRGLYRPERPGRSRKTDSSSNLSNSPADTGKLASRPHSTVETTRRAPLDSSRYANRNSFSGRISRHMSRHHHLEADYPSAPISAPSDWEMVASNPSPPVSVGSEGDSTSLDPRADKERWWRSIDRLTHSQPPKTSNRRNSMLSTIGSKR